MTSQFIAAAASVALLGAGFSAADGTRSADVLPTNSVSLTQGEAGSGSSRVDVIRSGPSGTAKITRTVLTDGTTVCTVTTGPAGSNGDAEKIVTNLIRDRACNGAPAPDIATSGFVGPFAIIPAVIAAAGAGGLAAAAGNDSAG